LIALSTATKYKGGGGSRVVVINTTYKGGQGMTIFNSFLTSHTGILSIFFSVF